MVVEGASVPASTNVEALAFLLRFHEIAAEPAQIRYRYAVEVFGAQEILRCARDHKLRARIVASTWDRLQKTPLPALAEGQDGEFVVLGRVADGKAIIHDPKAGRPQLISREEYDARFS